MDTLTAQRIFARNAAAVAFLRVETPEGKVALGSAFHVGEGVFVTARHCVNGGRIKEIMITEPIPVDSGEFLPGLPDAVYKEWDASISAEIGHKPHYKHFLPSLRLAGEPLLHRDADADIAIFKVADLHPAVPHVKLGIHWNEWVDRGLWHLTTAVVLGYPPIPGGTRPLLVAARGDVHAYTDLSFSRHIHFLLSSTARGGFSGGPVIHEDGFALGLVSCSLGRVDLPPELGFMAVLSVEPIRALLEETRLLPKCQMQYENELLGLKRLNGAGSNGTPGGSAEKKSLG